MIITGKACHSMPIIYTNAATTAHSAPAPTSTALAKFNVAHLSISACTVSPSATFASILLSSSAAAPSSSFFANSLLFVGTMNASVKGMMPGSKIVAATLSLNGVDVVSSVALSVNQT
jgi:hypothetical protein